MSKLRLFYAVYMILLYWVFKQLSMPTQAEIDQALCSRMGVLIDPDQFCFEFDFNCN
jgi:hypothetical protein